LKALETEYNIDRQGTNKFLIMKYLEFKMLDSILILNQVHKLQVLVDRLHDLKVVLPKTFQVKKLYQNPLPHGMTIGGSIFTCKMT